MYTTNTKDKSDQVKLLYGNSLSLRVQSEDKGWLLLHNLPWLPYCSYTSPIVNINKYCMVPWGVNFRITKSKAKLRTSCELHEYLNGFLVVIHTK